MQQIQNSLARIVVKAPKSCHITPILRSLHGLRTTERIKYKLLSLNYKVLAITQPSHKTFSQLHNLVFVKRPRRTRSSSVVTLDRPPTSFFLIITGRSFLYALPCLWINSHLFVNRILVPLPPFTTPSIASITHHFFIFWLTTLLIHNSLSISLPA